MSDRRPCTSRDAFRSPKSTLPQGAESAVTKARGAIARVCGFSVVQDEPTWDRRGLYGIGGGAAVPCTLRYAGRLG